MSITGADKVRDIIKHKDQELIKVREKIAVLEEEATSIINTVRGLQDDLKTQLELAQLKDRAQTLKKDLESRQTLYQDTLAQITILERYQKGWS